MATYPGWRPDPNSGATQNPDGSWVDAQGNPISGDGGSTFSALDPVGSVVNGGVTAAKKVYNSTQVKPPPNVADSPAGQQASSFAGDLINAQKGLGAPSYGSTTPIPAGARPTAPGADVYAQASQPLATAPTGYGDLAQGVNNMSAGLVQRGTVGAAPYNVGGTAVNQQNSQTAAAKQQIADYQKATAAWDQIYGGTAQQSGYHANAQQIAAPPINYQFGMNAPQAGTPQIQGGAPQVVADKLNGYYGVNAPSFIQAQQVREQLINPQSMQAPADIATNGPMRDAQLRAMGLYEGAANGTAPSAAEALLRKGIDENIGAQLGMAATLQGNTPGLALRSGLAGAQHAIAGSSADMAALRAQEQERGRAGFLAAATGIRAQDISIAQSNQTKDLTTAVTNLQAHIDVLKANQATALQAGMANQNANLTAQIHNAQNQLDAAKTSAANSLTRDIANMTASLDASKSNAANQVSQNIANLQSATAITQANLNSALQTGLAAEANRLQAQLQDQRVQLAAAQANQQALLDEARINAQTAQQNAQLAQQQQQFNSSNALNAQQFNTTAGMQQQTINNGLYNGLTNNALTAEGLTVGMTAADIQRKQAADQANAAANSALLGGVLGGGGTLLTNGLKPNPAPAIANPSFASKYAYGANGAPILPP